MFEQTLLDNAKEVKISKYYKYILLRGSIAMMIHHDQKHKLGKKRLLELTLQHCSSSLKEVSTGIQSGQDLRGKN